MKKMPQFFISLIALFMFSCSSETDENVNAEPAPVQQSYQHSNYELEVLDLLNDYRVSQGLQPLQIIEHISFVSGGHNDYMIAVNGVNHDGFEERKVNLTQVLNAYKVGENVAYGYSTPESVVQAWINSPPHKALLEGEFTHFGLSVKYNENNKSYFTNIFIKK